MSISDKIFKLLKINEFAFERQKVIKRYEDLHNPIKSHFMKCVLYPSHISSNHWKKELVNFLNELLRLKIKGSEIDDKFIDEYFVTYFDSDGELEHERNFIKSEFPDTPVNYTVDQLSNRWHKLVSLFRLKVRNKDIFNKEELYFLD